MLTPGSVLGTKTPWVHQSKGKDPKLSWSVRSMYRREYIKRLQNSKKGFLKVPTLSDHQQSSLGI